MRCPGCGGTNLVLRIVALEHFTLCPQQGCGYYSGPSAASAGADVAFA